MKRWTSTFPSERVGCRSDARLDRRRLVKSLSPLTDDLIMAKTALITGVTGQDGSYLAEFLLDRGYEVHGTCRRTSTDVLERVGHLEGRLHLHQADLHDQS